LKFNRVSTSVDSSIDDPLCDLKIAVVIDSDLSNDVGWMTISDRTLTQLQFTRH
jgi:hypothetical protein